MSDIFVTNKIIDKDNNEHDVFTEYFFEGMKYYITKDKLIFKKCGNMYEKVSSEITEKIINNIITYYKKDIVEFNDFGEK